MSKHRTSVMLPHRDVSPNSPLTVRVSERRQVAAEVVEFTLASVDGSRLPAWSPGSHIDVVTDAGTRQYSLNGDCRRTDEWNFAVLRAAQGAGGSIHLHDEVKEASRLEVVGLRNNFTFVRGQRYVFIAGGIGITPILPMIREAARDGADWVLHYGGRHRSAMAYVDRLLDIYGDRVEIWDQNLRGLMPVQAIVSKDHRLVYCCGPEPLLQAVEAACHAWPLGLLRLERFRAPEEPDSSNDKGFEARLARSGTTVHVGSTERLVDAIRASGIEVPTSCGKGVCGACETRVLSGIPQHRDSLLTPAERDARDRLLVCVSRSRTPVLELDL